MTMRLIDADAFLDFLRIEEKIMEDEEVTFNYIRSLMVSAPTIKARPIIERNCNYCHNGTYRKSFCQPDGTFARYANYCEECGRDLTKVVTK